ncbi:MAG: hypothetical protein AB7V08_13930 [Elusimicrobiales bacterium]
MTMNKTFLARVRAKLDEWREYKWLAVIVGLAYFAYHLVPSIDPRAGVDGFGDWANALVQAGKGILAVALAYLCKAHLTTDLTTDQEQRIGEQLASKPDWTAGLDSATNELKARIAIERAAALRYAATVKLAADRAGWVLWLGFWFFVLFH